MSKLFFDHLIIKDEIVADIDLHEVDQEARQELVDLIDEIISHHALNVVLSHLPKEHHSEFISKLTANPGDESIISYISSRVDVDIESELKKHLGKLKEDIKSEIKKSRSKK